jgi:hypothetical protein
VFLGLCGFEYDGPKGRIRFAPRISPENFRGAFTAAEGWGSFEQKREGERLTLRVTVRWGELRLRTFGYQGSDGISSTVRSVAIDGRPVEFENVFEVPARTTALRFPEEPLLVAGQTLEIQA